MNHLSLIVNLSKVCFIFLYKHNHANRYLVPPVRYEYHISPPLQTSSQSCSQTSPTSLNSTSDFATQTPHDLYIYSLWSHFVEFCIFHASNYYCYHNYYQYCYGWDNVAFREHIAGNLNPYCIVNTYTRKNRLNVFVKLSTMTQLK